MAGGKEVWFWSNKIYPSTALLLDRVQKGYIEKMLIYCKILKSQVIK